MPPPQNCPLGTWRALSPAAQGAEPPLHQQDTTCLLLACFNLSQELAEMGVERGNAVGWESPESLQLLPYSSPCLCLGFMVLKPPGPMATLDPQSGFSTQSATTAESITWHGEQHMGQAPTSSTSAPDLQDAPGQSSHTDSLSCKMPFSREGKRNTEMGAIHPPIRGKGWFEGLWSTQHQGGCLAPRSWQRNLQQCWKFSPFAHLAFFFLISNKTL